MVWIRSFYDFLEIRGSSKASIIASNTSQLVMHDDGLEHTIFSKT